MKISLDINTSRFALPVVGQVMLAAGGALLPAGIFKRRFWLPASALLLAGAALYNRKRQFLIRRPHDDVVKQIEKTLNLMGWQHSSESAMISVPALKAEISVRPLALVTLLAFKFNGEPSSREDYLVNTIIKFQRFNANAKE